MTCHASHGFLFGFWTQRHRERVWDHTQSTTIMATGPVGGGGGWRRFKISLPYLEYWTPFENFFAIWLYRNIIQYPPFTPKHLVLHGFGLLFCRSASRACAIPIEYTRKYTHGRSFWAYLKTEIKSLQNDRRKVCYIEWNGMTFREAAFNHTPIVNVREGGRRGGS